MARSQKQIVGDETLHYVSARREREKAKEHSPAVIQPPLTPMIDVVFQLLLFFLLACQFRMAEGQIPANLPDLSGPPPSIVTPDPIRVTLRPNPDNIGVLIEVERIDVPMTTAAELYGYLMQMKKHHRDKAGEVPVLIKPLRNVRWDHVVNAFNQAVRAKYKNVGFAPSG